jgi:hypothetical protein
VTDERRPGRALPPAEYGDVHRNAVEEEGKKRDESTLKVEDVFFFYIR